MKTVSLDQNKWIDLAKARVRADADTQLRDSFARVTARVERGAWIVPISSTHYLELARIKSQRRRADLGETMWEVSRGHTIASYSSIMQHEIDVALGRRFPGLQERPFALIGRGVAHAFGMPRGPYRIPAFARGGLSPECIADFEELAQEVIEHALLTGKTPDGTKAPTVGYTEHNSRFMRHLSELPKDLDEFPRDQWHDALVAMSLIDIQEPLNLAMEHHDIEWERLCGEGKTDLTRLLLDLPSRVIDLHMHWQVVKNPTLQPQETDLEDWGGLIPAAAHCDVLVCEKHFANLLAREGFRPRAAVLTDVRDLRDLD